MASPFDGDTADPSFGGFVNGADERRIARIDGCRSRFRLEKRTRPGSCSAPRRTAIRRLRDQTRDGMSRTQRPTPLSSDLASISGRDREKIRRFIQQAEAGDRRLDLLELGGDEQPVRAKHTITVKK